MDFSVRILNYSFGEGISDSRPLPVLFSRSFKAWIASALRVESVAAVRILSERHAEFIRTRRLSNAAEKAASTRKAGFGRRNGSTQPRTLTLALYGSSSFAGRAAVSIGSRLIRSYSAITWAPINKTNAPSSTLNSTAIAVVREP